MRFRARSFSCMALAVAHVSLFCLPNVAPLNRTIFFQGEKAMCLKFTAEQLGLVGIKSPLVEYARNQVMAEPTQACINPSARIDDKGELHVLAARCSPGPDDFGRVLDERFERLVASGEV